MKRKMLGVSIMIILIMGCEKDYISKDPMIKTGDFTIVSPIEINIRGEIISHGSQIYQGVGFSVFYNYYCSTEPNPTKYDEHLSWGLQSPNLGEFICPLYFQSENTKYYIRSYLLIATETQNGTYLEEEVYGDEISFTTSAFHSCGDISYGGKTYKTVVIGEQCWMKENLSLETENSNCYDDDPVNCETYGRLYDWNSMMNGSQGSELVPSGVQGICPDGWHIPSYGEWRILVAHVEGDVNKMKESGYKHWYYYYNFKANNRSGFTALPGGGKSSSYYGLHEAAKFWTSSKDVTFVGLYDEIRYLPYSEKEYSFSVRCVKDK